MEANPLSVPENSESDKPVPLEGWRECAARIGRADYRFCGQNLFGNWSAYQCGNKAKYDIILSHGRPTRCGVHSKAANARREAKAVAEKQRRDLTQKKYEAYREFNTQAAVAIRKIAKGHNDPRGLALEILEIIAEHE